MHTATCPARPLTQILGDAFSGYMPLTFVFRVWLNLKFELAMIAVFVELTSGTIFLYTAHDIVQVIKTTRNDHDAMKTVCSLEITRLCSSWMFALLNIRFFAKSLTFELRQKERSAPIRILSVGINPPILGNSSLPFVSHVM